MPLGGTDNYFSFFSMFSLENVIYFQQEEKSMTERLKQIHVCAAMKTILKQFLPFTSD